MKVLATFDGSPLSEITIPYLAMLAEAPRSEFVLLSVVEPASDPPGVASGVPLGLQAFTTRPASGAPGVAEEKSVEQRVAEAEEYLRGLAARLPESANVRVVALADADPPGAIVRFALLERPDIIALAAHGKAGKVHLLFGATAEQVARAAVAPVLLVHPESAPREE